MSYQYAQYGSGFDLDYPEPQALRFEELVTLRGKSITVIQQTITGYDDYGQQILSETEYTLQAIIETSLDETYRPPGESKEAEIEALFTQWAPIEEAHYELEVDGCRYHIVGVEKTSAYLRVKAGRKLE